MKVSEVRTRRTSEVKKRPSPASDGGTKFADHLTEIVGATPQAAGTSSAAAVSSTGAVLAAQEVDGSGDQGARRQAVRHGEDILDRLDEIRMDLLNGAIPKDRLQNLATLLRARRAQLDDPRLISIIQEIELRAEVEIAKYTRTI